MIKERYYVNPSSIGSYFGVGFNSPQDQLEIDLGNEEATFDEASEERMKLGELLEKPVLDWFEWKLKIIIDNRNQELLTFYDGKVKGKVDGMTMLNGVKTVVECKISNAQGYVFTENIGYLMQSQLYMYGTDAQQCLLCGQYQGRPIFKLIQRDEEMIADILQMVDFIVDCLTGLDDFDSFPTELLDKYSHTTLLPTIEIVTPKMLEKMNRLVVVKEEIKVLEAEASNIKTDISETYSDGVFNNDDIKASIYTKTRAGGLDTVALLMDNPTLNLDKYQKPDTTYQVVDVRSKKKKSMI